MILAIIFLGESITAIKVAAMLLIGVGTYLMIQKKRTSLPESGQGNLPKQDMLQQDSGQTNIEQQDFSKNLWIIYAFGAALFASLTSILGKVGIEGVESNLGTAIRTVVVLVMAWIVVFVTKKQNTIKNIDKKSWIFLILSGFATGGSWLCYYNALQDGPASVVVPIDKLSILLTIAFSYFFLKEKLTKKAILGLILLTAGTLSLLL